MSTDHVYRSLLVHYFLWLRFINYQTSYWVLLTLWELNQRGVIKTKYHQLNKFMNISFKNKNKNKNCEEKWRKSVFSMCCPLGLRYMRHHKHWTRVVENVMHGQIWICLLKPWVTTLGNEPNKPSVSRLVNMWEDKQTDNKELEITVVTLVLAVINIFKGEQEIKSMSGWHVVPILQ